MYSTSKSIEYRPKNMDYIMSHGIPSRKIIHFIPNFPCFTKKNLKYLIDDDMLIKYRPSLYFFYSIFVDYENEKKKLFCKRNNILLDDIWLIVHDYLEYDYTINDELNTLNFDDELNTFNTNNEMLYKCVLKNYKKNWYKVNSIMIQFYCEISIKKVRRNMIKYIYNEYPQQQQTGA